MNHKMRAKNIYYDEVFEPIFELYLYQLNRFHLFVIISSNLILKFIAINHKKKTKRLQRSIRGELKNPASSESNSRCTFANVNANNTDASITKWIDLIDCKVQKALEVIEEDVLAPKTFYSTRDYNSSRCNVRTEENS
ncbi:hypothetical protein GQX74_004916 [Glossina fuscipes]|nr:hypothetical protein GQX74_004916 [Glossina fuscipes]